MKTGNGIIQTGNGIISPISWPLIKKLLLQKVYNFYNGVQNWCWKVEMDLSKQEMELFLLFHDLWSKNFFHKMFLNFINKFKAAFKNRNRNYPNKKWNYFSYFLTTDQTTYFTKCCHTRAQLGTQLCLSLASLLQVGPRSGYISLQNHPAAIFYSPWKSR